MCFKNETPFLTRNNINEYYFLFFMHDILFKLFDRKILMVLAEMYKSDYASVREISRKTKLPVATVYRIFKKFEELGFLKKENISNVVVYKVSKKNELNELIEKLIPIKSPFDLLVEGLEKKEIKKVLLLDSGEKVASVWIIGKTPKAKLNKLVEKIKEKTGFSINAQTFTQEQFENLERLNLRPPIKKILYEN